MAIAGSVHSPFEEKRDVVRLLSYQAESSGLCDSPATGNGVAYRRDRNPSFFDSKDMGTPNSLTAQ